MARHAVSVRPLHRNPAMTSLRRSSALALTLLAIGACSREKISKPDASSVIQSAPSFKTSKVVYVPRVVAIPAEGAEGTSVSTREGEALTIIEIAAVDPVVALLRARGQVDIEDFVSPVASSIVEPPKPKTDSVKADSAKADSVKADSAKRAQNPDSAKGNVGEPLKPPPPKPLNQPQTSPPPAPPLARQWVHTLRVTPRPRPEMGDLAIDDGSDSEDSPRVQYTGRPIGRVPGWTLAVGTREFMRVLKVSDRGPIRDDVPGEVVVDFLWRWKPTRAGALFDVDGAEFQSLPNEVQQAIQASSLSIDASVPQWSRATLAKTSKGWRVTLIDWTFGAGKAHEPW